MASELATDYLVKIKASAMKSNRRKWSSEKTYLCLCGCENLIKIEAAKKVGTSVATATQIMGGFTWSHLTGIPLKRRPRYGW